jgi:hypothetical protein
MGWTTRIWCALLDQRRREFHGPARLEHQGRAWRCQLALEYLRDRSRGLTGNWGLYGRAARMDDWQGGSAMEFNQVNNNRGDVVNNVPRTVWAVMYRSQLVAVFSAREKAEAHIRQYGYMTLADGSPHPLGWRAEEREVG